MTRAFEEKILCPHCNQTHTTEHPTKRWMRGNPRLDSVRHSIVQYDCDLLLHKYMEAADKKGTRDIQCLMFVEIKSYGASLSEAQRDTLGLFSQALRNRRANIHQKKLGRHAMDHVPPAIAFSYRNKRHIRLWMYGGHLLRMSGSDPLRSEWMTWDELAVDKSPNDWDHSRQITYDQLIGLLRFDLDPDWHEDKSGCLILRPADRRRRYSDFAHENDILRFIESCKETIHCTRPDQDPDGCVR